MPSAFKFSRQKHIYYFFGRFNINKSGRQGTDICIVVTSCQPGYFLVPFLTIQMLICCSFIFKTLALL